METEQTFYIWSLEHNGWWRPGRCGYTSDLSEAGRYALEDAEIILGHANVVELSECAIPTQVVDSLAETIMRVVGDL